MLLEQDVSMITCGEREEANGIFSNILLRSQLGTDEKMQNTLPCLDAELYSPSNKNGRYLAEKHDPWWDLHVMSQLEVPREHHR